MSLRDEARLLWRELYPNEPALHTNGTAASRAPAPQESSVELFAPQHAVTAAKNTDMPWSRKTLDEVLAAKPPPWTVQDYCRAQQVGFIGAFPTVGKSTLAASWSMAVLYGRPWCGKRVRAGSVVCLIGEGRRGFCKRLDAYRRHHGLGAPPEGRYIEIVDLKLPLSSKQGQEAAKRLIEQITAQYGHAPALIVIDTLSSHWAESEDSAEFAAPAMRALAGIAEQHDCTVVVLHHTTKAKGRNVMPELGDMRGSGAFVGNTDFVVGMCTAGDGAFVEGLKAKDDERAPRVRLELLSVPCGTDEDGEPVTAGLFADVALQAAQQGKEAHDAEVTEDVMRVVRALAVLGTCGSKDGICRQAGMGFPTGRPAVAIAVSQGLIVKDGVYKVTEQGRKKLAATDAFKSLDEEITGGGGTAHGSA